LYVRHTVLVENSLLPSLRYLPRHTNSKATDFLNRLGEIHRAERQLTLALPLAAKAALFEPEYYVSKDSIREPIAHESVFNPIHHDSVIKVDFIVRKQSVYRQVEFERRQRVAILDFTTYS
jgi:hypothetical protein